MSKKGKSRAERADFFPRHLHNLEVQQPTEPILSPREDLWISTIVARARVRAFGCCGQGPSHES